MKMKNKRRSFRILALVLCLSLICPCLLGMAMADEAEAAETDSPEIAEVFVISEIDEEDPVIPEESAPAAAEEAVADEPLIEETTVEEPEIIEELEPEVAAEPDAASEPEPTAETVPDEPEPTRESDPDPTTEPGPDPTAESESTVEPEPTAEPESTTEPEPTAEPEPTIEPEPTTEPEPTAEPEPTSEPEPTAEPEPTETPAPAFELSHSGDEAWTNTPIVLKIRIRDLNSSGWVKVEVATSKGGERTELTAELAEKGFANYTVEKNCTVHVFITDTEGKEHTEKFKVSCFDYDGPRVTAGIDNTILRVEAVDTQSGVKGIYVNGNLYTTLENGILNLPASENTTDEKFTITAIDNLGNESKTVTISNPFYKESSSEHSHNCPDDCDCRTTPAPTQTPSPTQAPSSTSGQSGGSSGGSSGGGGNSSGGNSSSQSQTTQTPTPTPTATTANETKPDTEAKTTPEPIVIEPGTPFTESGNFTTRDLLYDKHTNKQFIVVETRNGATFYMVIDYDKPLDEDGERYETYFLNMVDEADLLALLDDGTAQKTPVCTCTDKCEPGKVNTACEVCRNNMSECTGKEAVTATPEPTTEPDTEPEPDPEKNSGGGVIIFLVLLALASGGAIYWFKFRKEKPKAKGPIDLDDYDYGEEDDEDYETEPDDADATETTDEGENDYE